MYSQELTEYVMKRAEFKARQVIRQVPSLGEVEDVRQDLIEDVLRRLPKFDGGRAGIKTFVSRIIKNKIADLLKSHEVASRGNGCAKESLDEWVRDETGNWVPRGATVEQSRGRAHLGIAARNDQEQCDLEMDITSVMASLSPQRRALCEMLRTKTPTEIARETGMARSVIYQHIAAIRAAFIEAGVNHYL